MSKEDFKLLAGKGQGKGSRAALTCQCCWQRAGNRRLWHTWKNMYRMYLLCPACEGRMLGRKESNG